MSKLCRVWMAIREFLFSAEIFIAGHSFFIGLVIFFGWLICLLSILLFQSI